jgi:hypothetical protein
MPMNVVDRLTGASEVSSVAGRPIVQPCRCRLDA